MKNKKIDGADINFDAPSEPWTHICYGKIQLTMNIKSGECTLIADKCEKLEKNES